MADMAHFAGLVAAEEHPSPMPYCDVVTTTTHKTLGGPRGGMILCREEYAKKINSRVFPGHQGGPLMHAIAGKAVAMKIAASDLFRERQRRTREGAAIVAEEMVAAGVNVLTGGTDVHLVLADLRESELDGQQAEDRLHEVGITVNRNAVPFDPRPPAVSSGLRIGTPALATRGFQADDFREVGRVIGEALGGDLDDAKRTELTERTAALADAPALSAARGAGRRLSLGEHDGSRATPAAPEGSQAEQAAAARCLAPVGVLRVVAIGRGARARRPARARRARRGDLRDQRHARCSARARSTTASTGRPRRRGAGCAASTTR